MNKHYTNIQTTPPPIPPGGGSYQFAHTFRKPGQWLCKDRVVFDDLEAEIRRHLFSTLLASLHGKAERFLIVQGLPGSGKTVAACDAALAFGWGVAHLSASMLASEHEGGAVAMLNAFLEEVVRFSEEHQIYMVVIIDDFDLSICSVEKNVAHTTNTGGFTERNQKLADTDEYQSFSGSVIPFICTGNDFTPIRESLFRAGRATWYSHTLTLDDILRVATHILKPRRMVDRKLVEQLVKKYRHEPVSIWRSVHNDMQRDRMDDMITRGLSPKEADRELQRPQVIDPQKLKAYVKARAGTQARVWFR